MKNTIAALMMGLLLLVGTTTAHGDNSGVVRFATLPPGPGHPEGIAADSNGNDEAPQLPKQVG